MLNIRRDGNVRSTNLWFYYGKSAVYRVSDLFHHKKRASVRNQKFRNKPVHKELYLYSVAFEQDCFECMLDYVLEVNHIYKDPSFDIISKGKKSLCLATIHPQKDVIERLLNNDTSIFDTYKRIESHYARISAIVREGRGVVRNFSINVSNEGYSISVD